MQAFRPRLAAAALPVLLILAGCGTGSVPPEQLEKTVSSKLQEQLHVAPKSVTCPKDGLKAEVGAKLTCTLTAQNGDTVEVYLTATEVNGNSVNFDFKVGTEVHKASS